MLKMADEREAARKAKKAAKKEKKRKIPSNFLESDACISQLGAHNQFESSPPA